MTEKKNEVIVTKNDIMKHYFATLFIYGALFFLTTLCPAYNQNISNQYLDYSVILGFFACGYAIISPIIYFITKPKSILESRSLAILGYFKRQFVKGLPLQAYLNNITPTEKEKQSMMILFMQVFFATFTAHMLCEHYVLNFGYNIDFLFVMFDQAAILAATNGILQGAMQFLIDTGDIWLKIIFTITTFVFLISYLSDCSLFRNKIKSVDTTPLGVISCICCYYPASILTYTFLKVTDQNLLPVENNTLLAILNLIVILANLGSLIAILRLGTKAGNLTNRGIVTGFPYNIVRHPDYSMQIVYILATSVPLFINNTFPPFEKFMMTLTTLSWIYIYFLRAVTEERHLMQDPEYQEYAKKVRHRFIPKLF